jgi:hypothetical protein
MGVLNRFYPHLNDPDIALFMDFFVEHGSEYQRFDYDVRVGPGSDPGPGFEATIREMALRLSRRRIDAVGHTKHRIDTIEICHSPNLRALGQIELYRYHYMQDFPSDLEVRQCLLCRELRPDIAEYVQSEGIQVWVYPA